MKLQDLRQFEQFSQLSDEQLILIKPKLKLKRCQAAGEMIIPRGYEKDLEFFLLQGSLLLVAEDGQQQKITADSPAARLSIARLRPSLYEVTSAQPCQLLAISGSLLTQQVQASNLERENASHSEAANKFYRRLKTALENRNFSLPSLPSVALKVREVLQQEEPEIKDLERVLNRDPSMLAKLIAAANSPLYRRGNTCQSSGEAIMRLGLDTTSQLVMLFSLRQLFKANNPWVKQRMTQGWCQGVKVAAIAQLLTLHHPHISADRALLVGLIHNLGELAILKFIDLEPEIDQQQMEQVLEELMPEAGVLLLNYWGFDEEVVRLVAQLNNWQSTSEGSQASLEDLIRVARLHSFIGTEKQHRHPRLDEVPAFQKLTTQGLTPEFSLTLVEDAADQVEEVQEMFGL
ncbi:HDOD domain-containing protein [Marinospirillum sp.]|uniref:HDOD domain-containing protein n=1 Tax=Marinospirillum sp. TaxID=2183934 RepID=UPI00286FFCE9|nr:HDOD domain-containing protein [Marinospirillum sp.]MDR9468775.1 HDOD domain-containing protein [Marinospirillum sp.]